MKEADHVFDIEIIEPVDLRVFRKLDRLALNRVIAVVDLVAGEPGH